MCRLPFLERTLRCNVTLHCTAPHSTYSSRSDQYCNAKTETVIVKNTKGEIVDKQTVETLVCDDGAKDFLAYSGIAKECKEYWFEMYISQQWIRKKGYVCQKFDGSWEMVNPIK